MAAFPRILHLHHSVCCNFTPLGNIWMNVSLPWTLCTQMQDQSGHGPETNSSIFRHNVETLPIWSGWFSPAQVVPQTKAWESFHLVFFMEWNEEFYCIGRTLKPEIWVVLISAGSSCVGTNQGFGKLRWVWTNQVWKAEPGPAVARWPGRKFMYL